MKYLRAKIQQWRNKVVLAAYNRYFGKYVYSFDKTDEKLGKISETERGEYYRAVTEWVNSSAYKLEYEGEINEIYEELASKTQTEDLMTAYRLVLLKLKNKDLRLKNKVKEYHAQKAFQSNIRKI